MAHARILTLDPGADPIHAAIARHRATYDAFQTAPADDEAPAAIEASAAYIAAADALVSTACATRFGALALLDYLRWWTGEERDFADDYQPAYGLAQLRVADLALFLGARASVAAIPQAAPCGRLAPASPRLLPAPDRYRQGAPSALANEPLPGEIEPWEAVFAVRPDTAHVRAPRFLDLAGEALAAFAIIAGGVAAYGFLPFA